MVGNLELRAASNDIARNEILFVGDDMGVSTVTATRIMDGQFLGGASEEHALRFEPFPNLALSKTCNTNTFTFFPSQSGQFLQRCTDTVYVLAYWMFIRW